MIALQVMRFCHLLLGWFLRYSRSLMRQRRHDAADVPRKMTRFSFTGAATTTDWQRAAHWKYLRRRLILFHFRQLTLLLGIYDICSLLFILLRAALTLSTRSRRFYDDDHDLMPAARWLRRAEGISRRFSARADAADDGLWRRPIDYKSRTFDAGLGGHDAVICFHCRRCAVAILPARHTGAAHARRRAPTLMPPRRKISPRLRRALGAS